ncbi:hypothetical protein BJX99DRAFT_254576 [Aspergillus californicus]
MPFKTLPASTLHRIPHLEGAPPCVHFDDAFGTETSNSPDTTPNSLTGSLFFLDFAEHPEPAPRYDYDETGVVLKGTLKLRDANGDEAVLRKGDTFFISRGSTIVFSTPDYAVAFKAAARWRVPSRL